MILMLMLMMLMMMMLCGSAFGLAVQNVLPVFTMVDLLPKANFQCHPMMQPWAEAAKRFPAIKFLQGVASEIIPDFPDQLTPTVIIYKDKECVKQVQGLDDWGGKRTSVDTIEWHLAELGIIETDQENDPRTQAAGRSRQIEDEEFDGKDVLDDRGYTSSRLDRILRGKWT